MPLSSTQLSDLQAAVADVTAIVTVLQADPDPNPLQVALDAANATIAALTAERDTANANAAAMQAKIDAAKAQLAAAATADAAEDAGRQGALQALG